MAEVDDDFVAVELEKDSALRFSSPEMLENWLTVEQDFWAWTRSVNEKPFGVVDDALGRWRERLSDARGSFVSLTNSSLPMDQRNQALKRLTHSLKEYAVEGFASVTPRASFIQHLRETDGDVIALAALNYALGGAHKPADSRSRKLLRRAHGLIDAFDANVEVSLPASVSVSVKKMVAGYQSSVRSEVSKAEAALKSLSDAQKRMTHEYDVTNEKFLKRTDEHSGKLQQDADAALERIETTRKAYQERMHLGASVEYWKEKAKGHEDGAKRLKKTVLWFSGIAGSLLAMLLAFLGFVGLGIALHKDASPTAPLLLLGIGVVATTGVMWAGRVLVRLFLSEHHLGIDARERATMALTFLALTNEGKIEPSERVLVLTPMFRPTTDGIVKDDAAPDATIAGHLSRVLGR